MQLFSIHCISTSVQCFFSSIYVLTSAQCGLEVQHWGFQAEANRNPQQQQGRCHILAWGWCNGGPPGARLVERRHLPNENTWRLHLHHCACNEGEWAHINTYEWYQEFYVIIMSSSIKSNITLKWLGITLQYKRIVCWKRQWKNISPVRQWLWPPLEDLWNTKYMSDTHLTNSTFVTHFLR